MSQNNTLEIYDNENCLSLDIVDDEVLSLDIIEDDTFSVYGSAQDPNLLFSAVVG